MPSRGRGPIRVSRAPIAKGYGDVRIVRGTITSVDKVKHTVAVHGEGGERWDGIAFLPRYLNADGTGSFLVPEVNMLVWVCIPSSDASPFILGAAVAPLNSEEGDDPNDYRMNRPVLNEGDEIVASRDSGYIIMRKGGMIEIASTQMARTFFIPVENLIQSFCENFVVDTPGASLSMLIRDEDETWGADLSPMEFKLTVKEFANDEFDIFDLRVGRIAAEDDTYIPPTGALGQIVARLVINRHFVLNVDKDGNFLRTLQGSETENIEGSKFSVVHKTFHQVVRGLMRHSGKDRSVELDGYDSLTVKGNRSVVVEGTLAEDIRGSVKTTVGGSATWTSGEVQSTVQGALNATISGPTSIASAGGLAVGAGENVELKVGGKLNVTVANGQFALGELTGVELVVVAGEMHAVSKLGKVIVASGGLAEAASARVVLKPSGTIVIQNALGVTAEFEVNGSGVSLKTPGGSVTLDLKGSVALGTPIGGAVVTTFTHPVDYITGIPILGVTNVTAGGVPGVVPVYPVFLPDPS